MEYGKPIRRVAVVGAGLIGSSWVAQFLARGLDVVATDPAPNAEANLERNVQVMWPALTSLGLSPGASLERLQFTAEMPAALAKADFVQESGPERLAVKVGLFSDMDRAAPPDSLIASSSSALAMSQIQVQCEHPERCIIGHPFNPPHLIPLVEVVGGAQTSPQAVDRAIEFYASIGKKPIRLLKEVNGHAANRLQWALYREIVYLVEQGVLSVEDADTAVRWGPGLRWAFMGPSLLWHLAGGEGGIQHFLSHLGPAMAESWKSLGEPELTPELAQALIDGTLAEAGGRSLEELGHVRDKMLLEILNLRRTSSRE